jgi:stearoyl-CoA 9-desaturase NADPH oxidoreductase
VAERGAAPVVPAGRRRALALARSFTSPLLPDDYLEMVNPLWSTRELRGRVVKVVEETADAVSIVIKPGWEWPGHRAGQYLRLGIAVNGRHHWRAYSLTSAPDRPDGCIAITPKLVDGGQVSPFLCRQLRPGTIVRLGGVEGSFHLPERLERPPLFISAGSGITPIMSMLRSLEAGPAGLRDVVHIHSAPSAEGVIFGEEMRALARSAPGYRLLERHTRSEGRMRVAELDRLCPDWRERAAFVCGPPQLLAELRERWRAEGIEEHLRHEHFQPDGQLGDGEHGAGGTVRFRASGIEAEGDGSEPILALGEQAGACLEHGCRMGICHSCTGRLLSGQVRDLRTGRVHGRAGEDVRICVNAPEGAVELDL